MPSTSGAAFHDRAISLRDVVLFADADDLTSALADIERLSDAYKASATKMDDIFAAGTGVTPTETQILESIKDIEAKTLPLITQVIALRQSGGVVAAHDLLMAQARPAFKEWLKRINQFIDLEEAANQSLATDTRSVAHGFQVLMIFLCLGALVIGFGVAIWAASVVKPLKVLTDVMKRLARGDLTAHVVGTDRTDEIGAMASAVEVFKQAAHRTIKLEAEAGDARTAEVNLRDRQNGIDQAKAQELRDFIGAVEAGFDALSAGDLTVRMDQAVAPEFEPIRAKFNDSRRRARGRPSARSSARVGTIRTGLGEISVASNDLSQRTEQQAASLEETVAALSEVTRGVNDTAGCARPSAQAGRRDARRRTPKRAARSSAAPSRP